MAFKSEPPKRSLMNSEKAGLTSFVAALLLTFLDPRLTALPLGLFLACCMVMPFFPTVSFFLPVISRGPSSRSAVAMTFDDGPDPATTPGLLELLAAHGVRGTFFVTGERAARFPELVEAIISHGHAIGNHSYHHGNSALFRSPAAIRKEIEATQAVLRASGVVSLAFRPPAGITTPRLRPALRDAGMFVVNFSCRALDGGNRWIDRIAERILRRVKPGDIILLHDIAPQKGRPAADWLHQVAWVLKGLELRGFEVLPLSELIGRPVMLAAGVKNNGRSSERGR